MGLLDTHEKEIRDFHSAIIRFKITLQEHFHMMQSRPLYVDFNVPLWKDLVEILAVVTVEQTRLYAHQKLMTVLTGHWLASKV